MALSDSEILAAITSLDSPRKVSAAEWASRTLPRQSAESGFDRQLWKAAAAFGVQGVMMPAAMGGDGASAVEAMLTFEGLGLGSPDNGTVFALASQTLAMQRALLSAASPEQLERWLPPLIAGDAIGSFAMSEPNAGSDTGAITTTATLQRDGAYVLNGNKSWVTLGPECDVLIAFATTDPSLGHWGITAFVVDAALPGVAKGSAISKMGLHSSPFGTVTFEDCRLSASDVLGTPGAGGAIFTQAVEGERAFLFAAPLGAMERTLRATVDRARSRQQYGKPIGSFQAVSHRIADMKLRHETSRLLLYKAAVLYDQGEPMTMATAVGQAGDFRKCRHIESGRNPDQRSPGVYDRGRRGGRAEGCHWRTGIVGHFRNAAKLDRSTAAPRSGDKAMTQIKGVEGIHRLTPTQAGMLYECLTKDDPALYFEQFRANLGSNVDPDRLKAAWQAVTDRHEALRTMIVWEGIEDPVQVVRRNVEVRFQFIDAVDGPDPVIANDLAAQYRRDGIALDTAPLFSVTLLLKTDGPKPEFHMIWNFHHIIVDGWSAAVVVDEVLKAYDGQLPKSDAPRFSTYLQWLETQDAAAALRNWSDLLTGVEGPTRLRLGSSGVDDADPAKSSPAGDPGRAVLRASISDTRHIEQAARELRVTQNTVLQGACALASSPIPTRLTLCLG